MPLRTVRLTFRLSLNLARGTLRTRGASLCDAPRAHKITNSTDVFHCFNCHSNTCSMWWQENGVETATTIKLVMDTTRKGWGQWGFGAGVASASGKWWSPRLSKPYSLVASMMTACFSSRPIKRIWIITGSVHLSEDRSLNARLFLTQVIWLAHDVMVGLASRMMPAWFDLKANLLWVRDMAVKYKSWIHWCSYIWLQSAFYSYTRHELGDPSIYALHLVGRRWCGLRLDVHSWHWLWCW